MKKGRWPPVGSNAARISPDNFQYDMEASLALPDAGGSGECFAKMQRLYDRLREHPATSASCSTPL